MLDLVETMGSWQADNVVGGQILYTTTDEEWRPQAALQDLVEEVVATTPGLAWSIRLGGTAVLGGTDAALAAATARLPSLRRGRHDLPLRLPMHSAFHTALLAPTRLRARAELGPRLAWRAPRLPLVDGRGQVWRPRWADPLALGDYTLGAQVAETFDFTAAVRTLLGDYAPDAVLLPGTGETLGPPVVQVMIALGWQRLRSRSDFLERQARDPLLLSLARPEQAALVVRSGA